MSKSILKDETVKKLGVWSPVIFLIASVITTSISIDVGPKSPRSTKVLNVITFFLLTVAMIASSVIFTRAIKKQTLLPKNMSLDMSGFREFEAGGGLNTLLGTNMSLVIFALPAFLSVVPLIGDPVKNSNRNENINVACLIFILIALIIQVSVSKNYKMGVFFVTSASDCTRKFKRGENVVERVIGPNNVSISESRYGMDVCDAFRAGGGATLRLEPTGTGRYVAYTIQPPGSAGIPSSSYWT